MGRNHLYIRPCAGKAPKPMKTQRKILTAFRLKPALKRRLTRFAKRKNATNTAVVESLIGRHCLTPKEEKL